MQPWGPLIFFCPPQIRLNFFSKNKKKKVSKKSANRRTGGPTPIGKGLKFYAFLSSLPKISKCKQFCFGWIGVNLEMVLLLFPKLRITSPAVWKPMGDQHLILSSCRVEQNNLQIQNDQDSIYLEIHSRWPRDFLRPWDFPRPLRFTWKSLGRRGCTTQYIPPRGTVHVQS